MEFVPLLFLSLLFWGVMVTSAVWMAVSVFKDSIKAGLAWVFIPFYFIVYLSDHWGEMKKPFFIWLAGTIGMGSAALIFNLI